MKFFLLASLVVLLGSIGNAQALSCAIPELGAEYDKADYVLHGKVIEKNYLTWDYQMPAVTFQMIQSFKGEVYENITVTVNESWDYFFEEGYEYIIFVKRNEMSLEIDPCSPKAHAFQSTIDIMTKLSMGDQKVRSSTPDIFLESLTDKESEMLETYQKDISDKKLERWDDVTTQRTAMIFAGLAAIPITGVAAFVMFRRRK